jgi:hypothetical protein
VSLPRFAGTIADRYFEFDLTVTIYQSGIAILAAYGPHSENLTLDEIVTLQRFSSLQVEKCEISDKVFFRYTELALKHGKSLTKAQKLKLAENFPVNMITPSLSEYDWSSEIYPCLPPLITEIVRDVSTRVLML